MLFLLVPFQSEPFVIEGSCADKSWFQLKDKYQYHMCISISGQLSGESSGTWLDDFLVQIVFYVSCQIGIMGLFEGQDIQIV